MITAWFDLQANRLELRRGLSVRPSDKRKMSSRRRRDDPPDPIAEYREWSENRYNPGYWTGGKVPPSVRRLWSTGDRRAVGFAGLVMSAILGYYAYHSSSEFRIYL